jgi:hypothetical protein
MTQLTAAAAAVSTTFPMQQHSAAPWLWLLSRSSIFAIILQTLLNILCNLFQMGMRMGLSLSP